MSTRVICHVDNFLSDILAAIGSSASRSNFKHDHNFEFSGLFNAEIQNYSYIVKLISANLDID